MAMNPQGQDATMNQSMPAWINEAYPYHGPCGLCGGDDARHRVLDAIAERVQAGEEAREVAIDYGFDLSFVQRVADEWEVEDD